MKPQTGASDIDTTMAMRQAGGNEVAIANFISTRTAIGTADAAFSFGTRALRPSSGVSGDRYYANDIGTTGGWLYYWTGIVWEIVTGWASGTDAVRAAITVSSVDNGAWFYASDTAKFWEVSAGAWVDRTPAISTEAIQDIVGAMMADSATIDFTYNDGAGTITGDASGVGSSGFADMFLLMGS